VTVELKLEQGFQSTEQAKAHRYISDEVYIGLPAPFGARVIESSRKTQFKASGVGILSITSSRCSVVLPAAKTEVEPYPCLRLIALRGSGVAPQRQVIISC